MKLDLYGLKFFYTLVLVKPWLDIPMIKPPRRTKIPDILTTEEVRRLFLSTHKLSYRVFFFTLYSLGLRLSEGLNLQLGEGVDLGCLKGTFRQPTTAPEFCRTARE